MLMIKDSGDWTKEFVRQMHETKSKLLPANSKVEPYEFLFEND